MAEAFIIDAAGRAATPEDGISLVKMPRSVIPIYNLNKARDFARRYLVPVVLQAAAKTTR